MLLERRSLQAYEQQFLCMKAFCLNENSSQKDFQVDFHQFELKEEDENENEKEDHDPKTRLSLDRANSHAPLAIIANAEVRSLHLYRLRLVRRSLLNTSIVNISARRSARKLCCSLFLGNDSGVEAVQTAWPIFVPGVSSLLLLGTDCWAVSKSYKGSYLLIHGQRGTECWNPTMMIMPYIAGLSDIIDFDADQQFS